MEGVAAAASIGQLVQYGGVVTVTLIRLIKDIGRGPLVYKNEESNVRLLLRLVHRVSTETDCHTRNESHDDFLELFTRVNLIAHSILQLLDNTSCFVFRVVSAVTRHSSLAEAFQKLCNTRELLHLHITSTLSRDVKAYLESGTRNMDRNSGSDPMGRAGDTNASPIREQSPSGRYNVSNNVVGPRTFYEIGHDIKSAAEAAARSQGTVTVDNNQIGEDVYHKIGDIGDRAGLNETLKIFGQIAANAPRPAPPGQQPNSAWDRSPEQANRHSQNANEFSFTRIEGTGCLLNHLNQPTQPLLRAKSSEAPAIGDLFGAEDDEPAHNKKGEPVKVRQR
ncbi:hypothetical protein PGQ11_007099 [Apiospora arundinis]|uniref:Uncharacterized protein n=1 Tax=Apiospora arundinis TaxID=335852 RepID=A0ABR2IUQ1_9PEZI